MKQTAKKKSIKLSHLVVVGTTILVSALLLFFITTVKDLSQPSAINAATTDGIGVVSDSDSDEYRAEDNRGGAYAATTLNWLELLVSKRSLNFGPWGTWGDVRRTGYKYNWSLSGATMHDMITNGQHTGLATQIASGEVKHALIHIGINDFHVWNGTYQAIYDGTLSGTALQAKLDGMIQDMATAVDTLKAAGPVNLVVTNIADPGTSPERIALFPDATKRQRVTAAIQTVNSGIASIVQSRGATLVDMNAFATGLLAQVDAQGFLHVGTELIDLLHRGDEPHHMQLGDNSGHAGTVANGLIANYMFVSPMNTSYQLGITPFTHSEMTINAGILPLASATPSASPSAIPTSSPTSIPTPTIIPTIAPTKSPSPTPTPTPVVKVGNPSAYTINVGSLQSGSLSNLVNDDNKFLAIRSTTSGSNRSTNTDFGLVPIPLVGPSSINVSVRVKSSNASTSMATSIYNFTTATWQQVDTFSIGTAETTRSTNVSNVAQYIDATNRMGIKVTSAKGSTTHTISYEKIALTFTK